MVIKNTDVVHVSPYVLFVMLVFVCRHGCYRLNIRLSAIAFFVDGNKRALPRLALPLSVDVLLVPTYVVAPKAADAN